MKTLSYIQPWAFLVAAGIKPIENRTWKLPEKYKGQRVLVHASAKLSISISMFEHLTEQQRWQTFEVLSIEDYQRDLKTSAIIGSVEIVDCIMNHPSIWAEHEATVYSQKQGKKIIVPVWNWVLANPVLFPEPIPAKGKLSFWDYPNILAEPEEKGGELFCHCQIPVKEEIQVMIMHDHFRCRYCGGVWYK